MQRGDIWWASLPSPQGSGPWYRRPVLVVQSNPFNQSQINTVVVVIITSNLRLAGAPGNVQISSDESQLPKDSVINVSQILTVDKSYLTEFVCGVDAILMTSVDDGVRLVIGT